MPVKEETRKVYIMENKKVAFGRYLNSIFYEKDDFPWILGNKDWGFTERAEPIAEDVYKEMAQRAHDTSIQTLLMCDCKNPSSGLMSIELLARTIGWKQLKKNSSVADIKGSLKRLGIKILTKDGRMTRAQDLSPTELWSYSIPELKTLEYMTDRQQPKPHVQIYQDDITLMVNIARKPLVNIKLPTLLMILLYIRSRTRVIKSQSGSYLGQACFIALDQLAKVVNISRTTIRKYIDEFENEHIFTTTYFTTVQKQRSPLLYILEDSWELREAMRLKWYKSIGTSEEEQATLKMDAGINTWQQKRNRLNRKSQISNQFSV